MLAKIPYLNRIHEYLPTSFADECSACQTLKSCLSGCVSQKIHTYGDLVKRPDPMCLKKECFLIKMVKPDFIARAENERNNAKNVFISHHHKDDSHVDKLTKLLRKKGFDIRNSSIRAKPQTRSV